MAALKQNHEQQQVRSIPITQGQGCSTPRQPQAPVLPCFCYNPCRKRGCGAAKASWEIQQPEETRLSRSLAVPPESSEGQTAEPGLGARGCQGRMVGHQHQPLPREIHTWVEFCHRQGVLNAQVNQVLACWG